MVSRGTAAIRACRHHKLQFRRLMSNLSEYRVSQEEEIWARCDFSTTVRGVFLPFAAADGFLCRAVSQRDEVRGAQSRNQRLPRFPEIVDRDRQHAFRPTAWFSADIRRQPPHHRAPSPTIGMNACPLMIGETPLYRMICVSLAVLIRKKIADSPVLCCGRAGLPSSRI